MDSFATILYAAVIFNLLIVLLAVGLVIRSRSGQKTRAILKRKQLVEQGKIIIAQESLIKSKQELLNEKDELLKEYRKLL